tara:strand:- start:1707 stop:2858 length:1152 start_codon:yes stop_codon:yes gene_type:complete
LKILKDISTIGFGDFVASGIAAAFWFYLASLLTPADYGYVHYILSIGVLTSTLTLLGTQNILVVYIAKNKNIVKSLLNLSFFTGLVILLICTFVFGKLDIGLLIFGITIFTYGISKNLATKSFKKYSSYSILQKSLTAIFGLICFYFFGVEGVVFGIALSYFVYLKLVLEDLKISRQTFTELKSHYSELKSNKNFILNNYFLMITNSVTTQVDKIIIVPFLGLALLGNYSLSLQIIIILTAVPGIIFKFVLPHTIGGQVSKNLKRNTILLSFGFTFIGVVIAPLLIPIFFSEYNDVINIIQIMSFSVIPITINLFYFAKFLSIENGRIPLYGGILSSSIMTVGMISLGSLFGAQGIAVTHVMSYSSLCLFSYIMNKKISGTNL